LPRRRGAQRDDARAERPHARWSRPGGVARAVPLVDRSAPAARGLSPRPSLSRGARAVGPHEPSATAPDGAQRSRAAGRRARCAADLARRRRTMRLAGLLTGLAISLFATATHAELFRCKGPDGKTIFTDQKSTCPGAEASEPAGVVHRTETPQANPGD